LAALPGLAAAVSVPWARRYAEQPSRLMPANAVTIGTYLCAGGVMSVALLAGR
jgi:hypothetical protein